MKRLVIVLCVLYALICVLAFIGLTNVAVHSYLNVGEFIVVLIGLFITMVCFVLIALLCWIGSMFYRLITRS
jgi:hypothetical protein